MGLFHFEAKHICRGAGQSLFATWAYDARSRLYDPRTGTWYDFSGNDADLLSQGAVGLTCRAEQLVAAIEKAETNKNAALGMSIIAAGQHELRGDNAAIGDAFCRELYARWGLPSVWALHRAPRKKTSKKTGQKSLCGDARNYHFHLIVGLRPVDKNGQFSKNKFQGFTSNTRRKGPVDALAECRKLWAEITNDHLSRGGFPRVRVDHRSYAEQGLELEPTIHEGAAITYQRRKGYLPPRVRANDAVKSRNKKRCGFFNKPQPVTGKSEEVMRKQATKVPKQTTSPLKLTAVDLCNLDTLGNVLDGGSPSRGARSR